jgi:AraC-like DNA-binding protein
MQVIMFDPSFVWSGGNNMLDYEYLKPFLETECNFCNRLDRQNNKIQLIISTILEIEEEYRDMNPGYELMIKSLLLKLMTLIIRHFKRSDEQHNGESISPKVAQKIREVIEYIETYYFKPLKIAELAGIVQMSSAYFSCVFKILVGVPPMDFIIRKRISVAKEMIKNTNQKMLYIAQECGFNSISNFNHIFKAYTGLSPGIYKKS